MTKIEANQISIEIFTLILLGGGVDKLRAVEMIRRLTPEGRRDLRAACQRLDKLAEDTWMDELRDKRINARKD